MTPPLTALDIVVLLMVVLGALMGALRGFVQEVLSLFAWVAGALALKLFYAPVAVYAERWTGSESGGAVLAFVLVFIVTYALFRALATNLGERTRTSIIGPVDRFLGFGFGALKGVLGASLLFLAITLAFNSLYGPDEARPSWLAASRTSKLLTISSRLIVDFVERRQILDAPGAAAPDERAERPEKKRGEGEAGRTRDAIGDLIGDSSK